ncbi:MAG: ABC transporter ATP-binding protein [Eubacteriales bacterium]|nr:ABC transporter ATP-binding protein [Eubacteriales bacterium]
MRELINKFTFGHPKQIIGPAIWLFFENVCTACPGIAAYFAINMIVTGAQSGNMDLHGMWILAGVMLGLTIVQYFVSVGAYLGTFIPATNHSAENKIAFIKKMRTLPLGYFQKKQTGELINTFTNDFLALEQSMVAPFTGLFSMIFFALWSGAVMLVFNRTLALAFYICIPFAAILIAVAMKMTDQLTRRTQETRDRTATFLNEYLRGMRTLKAYNQTGEGFCKLRDAYKDFMDANIRSETISGALLRLANTLIETGIPMLCFAGAYMLLEGRLTLADYLAVIVFSTKIVSPLLTWARYMVTLRSYFVSVRRVDAAMKETSMSGENSADPTKDIEFRNVSFSYKKTGGEPVLKNVSFTIPANRLTAVVGPSGGGKSTILRLIARFWDTDDGQILCDGKDLKTLDAEGWLNNISMVLQDVYLFHETIRENILFGRKDATEEEMIAAARQAQCHDFIMSLPEGYDTVVGEGGSTLSGGEKQRISIARAILKNAPILLLDEPTASLDARNEVQVQQAIGDLVKGKTVVMIAHRLKTAENADQILVVQNGQICEHGHHKDLMNQNGLYSHLWLLQNQSKDWAL